MLRIIHTSDWHIGKKLHRFSRRDEHLSMMSHFIQEVIQKKINYFIIAGDIFDQYQPSNEALQDFLTFIKNLIQHDCLPVLISGNHDSASLFKALESYLEKDQVTIFDNILNENEVIFTKENISFLVKGLPYFKESQLWQNQAQSKGENQSKSDDSDEDIFDRTIQNFSKIKRKEKFDFSVFIGHHLFSQYQLSGSEDAIFLSGVDAINYKNFDFYDYFAFGHIHQYQRLSDKAFYSGSPLPINFGENQQKYYNLISYEKSWENIKIDKISLPSFRKLYLLKADRSNIFELIKRIDQADSGKLHGIAEVIVNIDEPDPYLYEQIKAELLLKEIELIHYVPYLKSQESALDNLEYERLYNLNIDTLFQEYFLSKYPNLVEVPKNYLLKFQQIKQGRDED